MTPLEIVCATLVTLAGMGEVALARKWVRFAVSIGTPAPPKNSVKKTGAAEKPDAEPVPLKEVA